MLAMVAVHGGDDANGLHSARRLVHVAVAMGVGGSCLLVAAPAASKKKLSVRENNAKYY